MIIVSNSRNMKKAIILILLVPCLTNCGHREKIKIHPPQQQDHTIFYPEKKHFSHYKKSTTPLIYPALITIAAVGDIMLGEHAVSYINKYGTNYPFDSTKARLTNAHFTIGNLEAPFALSGTKFDKRFNFKVPPHFANGLVDAGFDVMNLANNHLMDYGKEALISTLNILDSLGIRHCGAGLNYEEAHKPALFELNGTTVAFLGYSLTFPSEFWATDSRAGTAYPRDKSVIKAIKHCEEIADITVVSFHWGGELRSTPKEYQKHFAHLSINAGADLILGHHPHVLQGIEIYKNRLIIYSLGNFAFAQYGNKKTNDSIILKTYLTKKGLLFSHVIPISVNNYQVAFQPRVLRGKVASSILTHLNDISLELNQGRKIINTDGIVWGDLNTVLQ